MSEPFLGEVKIFAGNFAPRNWALCDGALLPIQQHSALYSLLGTTFGGDGRLTFALPDLRGRTPVHQGNGPGLPPVNLGERGGSAEITLNPDQMPDHSHPLNGSSQPGNAFDGNDAVPAVPFAGTINNTRIYSTGTPDITFNTGAIGNTGGTTPVDVRGPYLAMNYIIALQGVFPSRN